MMAAESIDGAAGAAALFVCDHAAHAVPDAYGDLGLPAAELRRHIGWDIGAAELTRGLAQAFAAPAVLGRWSRLLIDLNRAADDPTLICEVSDGTIVPANRALDDAERAARIAAYHRPYHALVAARIDAMLAARAIPAVLCIHSFTPAMKGRPRPWHVGVLWDRDPRLAVPLMDLLRAEGDLVVGDNEPYTGRSGAGFTMRHHAAARGLPHVLIEVRQDLIADAAGVAAWTRRLERILRTVLARGPFIVEHYP